MIENTPTLAIGIDVGGTEIKAGLVTCEGEVVEKRRIATEVQGGVAHVINRIAELIDIGQKYCADNGYEVAGAGIGIPGTLSHKRGVVIAPPNLPGWRNVPLVERLRDRFDIAINLDNDANNAALGEFICGSGRGTSDMVMLTLGTGVGGGIILGGRLWRGSREDAGELGHMIVETGGRQCTCGQQGCLEAYASATNTALRLTERIHAGHASMLKEVVDRGEKIDTKLMVNAAWNGDALSMAVWEETCRYLAVGCININHAFNPQRVVLAGGMSLAGERLRGPVVRRIYEMHSSKLGEPPEIRLAELGNDAGFIGSALGVFQERPSGENTSAPGAP